MSSEESMKTRSRWDLKGEKGYEMNNSPSKNVPSDPVVGEQQRKQRPYNKISYGSTITSFKELKHQKNIKGGPRNVCEDKSIIYFCTDNIPPYKDFIDTINFYIKHNGKDKIIQNWCYWANYTGKNKIDENNCKEQWIDLRKQRKYDELCYANRDRDLSTHVQDDRRGIKQNHNFVVFDTEGNPLKKEKPTDLRELYARKITMEGKKLDEINLLELDKLEDDKARGKAAGRILELIDQNTIVVAHNIKHEIDILAHYNMHLPECFGYICTAKENNLGKLEKALSKKNIDFEKSDLHHAKYDTVKTIELLFKNLEENRRVTYLYGEEIVNTRYADDK